MKTLGVNDIPFPEDLKESMSWQPTTRRIMLHSRVMVFAKTRMEGMWNAYCFPVPGQSHDNEEYLWETEGVKLSAEHARFLFPFFEGIHYAR